MEEKPAGATGSTAESTQELAMEGEKRLEETLQAAFQIISSMNYELCNLSLWTTTNTATQQGAVSEGASNRNETAVAVGGNTALNEARLQYKNSVASLRFVLACIPNSHKAKALISSSATSRSSSPADENEIEKLEERALSLLRVVDCNRVFEIAEKNVYIKLLMDQLQDLIADISFMANP